MYQDLEIDKVLAVCEPLTDGGRKLLRSSQMDFETSATKIEAIYKRIQTLMRKVAGNSPLLNQLKNNLSHLISPNRHKLIHNQALEIHEVFELKQFCHYYQKLRQAYIEHSLPMPASLPDTNIVYLLLDPEGIKLPVFRISPAYDVKLKKIYQDTQKYSAAIRLGREKHLAEARRKLSIPSLKEEVLLSRLQQQQISHLMASGYFRVVSENAVNIGLKLIDDAKVEVLRTQLAQSLSDLNEAEERVLAKLNQSIASHKDLILKALELSAEIDLDFARLCFGMQTKGIIPKLCKLPTLNIQGARNLLLERHLTNKGRAYQSIDLAIDQKVNILSGPNMGGKSSALKTLGQIALLTRLGYPLPCSKAELPLFDFVFINHEPGGGNEDLSSFGKEIVSLIPILKTAGRGLVLLDEVGRGTNPIEGDALATAILGFLSQQPHMVFAATHYNTPTELREAGQYTIRGLSDVSLDKLEQGSGNSLAKRLEAIGSAMDYGIIRLYKKQAPPHCALLIATHLGLPEEIVNMAKSMIDRTFLD